MDTRIGFIVELARRLHQYGTAAQRLESAIDTVSRKLGLNCNVLSTPTSIIMSFHDSSLGEDGVAAVTQVVRLPPGEVNLRRLCQADAIAERVFTGELDIESGYRELRAIPSGRGRIGRLLRVLGYGVAALNVTAILRGSWMDLAVAAACGLAIGALSLACDRRPHLAASFEAIAALLVTLLATAIAAYVVPLSVKTVVLAGLIVLMPGLMLTTAVMELSTQHLVSGTARLAGAITVLLKLTFGTVVASHIALSLGMVTTAVPLAPVPDWAQWPCLLAGSYFFAVLFQADKRDFPLVMASVWLGYASIWLGNAAFGGDFGVFLAGVVVASAANIFTRRFNRPGALVRVPGIILLVPGSVGFRSLSFVFERDVFLGMETAFSLITLLISLVAGLLFGNLLVPPRRSLS